MKGIQCNEDWRKCGHCRVNSYSPGEDYPRCDKAGLGRTLVGGDMCPNAPWPVPGEGSAAVKHAQPKFKYKVRLTRMLNAWVEVEAANQDEAESQAYDEAVGKAKDAPCWSDDDDVQVEDDTHVMVDGAWKRARFVPKELGGEGVKPTSEGD